MIYGYGLATRRIHRDENQPPEAISVATELSLGRTALCVGPGLRLKSVAQTIAIGRKKPPETTLHPIGCRVASGGYLGCDRT